MKTLLLVDDQVTNLKILEAILADEYELLLATCGIDALDIAKLKKPDLILMDVEMPDVNGYAVCLQLKSFPDTRHIPVIFVTALSNEEDEARGFDVGGVDYISKPVRPSIVRRRVATHLSLVAARELQETQNEAIHMLGTAGHYNDNDTGVHIWRMGAYAGALAREIGWGEKKASELELAATMHDTGKIGIPDDILKAPRKLTEDEWELMKTHTTIGYRILSQCHTSLFRLASEVALYHHEKWDGSGYPEGLSGKDIPESARIVALADVFDALTMKRPYKEAWSVQQALDEIGSEASGHFDPELVSSFQKILPDIRKIQAFWNERQQQMGLQ